MEVDSAKIKRIAQKYHLKILILFGSQAAKQIHSESDVDIAFFAEQKVDEEKLYEDLMALLRRADIDLINLYTHHDPLLRYQILSKGKVLYEAKLGLKSTMEWQSYFDFVDFKKYYDMRSEILSKQIGGMAV